MTDTDFELDDDFYKMSREELLEDIKYRIISDREMLILNWKEKKALKQDIKMLEDALRSGTKTLEMTSIKISEYDRIMRNATRTIYMWKYSCYALVVLLIVIALMIK